MNFLKRFKWLIIVSLNLSCFIMSLVLPRIIERLTYKMGLEWLGGDSSISTILLLLTNLYFFLLPILLLVEFIFMYYCSFKKCLIVIVLMISLCLGILYWKVPQSRYGLFMAGFEQGIKNRPELQEIKNWLLEPKDYEKSGTYRLDVNKCPSCIRIIRPNYVYLTIVDQDKRYVRLDWGSTAFEANFGLVVTKEYDVPQLDLEEDFEYRIPLTKDMFVYYFYW